MTTPAKNIIQRVAEGLYDIASVRWTVDKLVRDLNAGQREIATKRPDVVQVIAAPFALADGVQQTIPAAAVQLSAVNCNTTSRRAVTLADADLLDAIDLGWQSRTGTTAIIHYMYDIRTPRTFQVYPPAIAPASVDIQYPAYPADITVPAPGLTYTGVTGNISLPDEFGNALVHWGLYNAFSVDAEFGGNEQKAQEHLSLFNAALSDQLSSATAVAPTK